MEEILDLLKQNARLYVKDIAAMTKKLKPKSPQSSKSWKMTELF